MNSDLIALAERVEGLPGPDRRTDADIHLLLKPKLRRAGEPQEDYGGALTDGYIIIFAPHYTASLDAAKMLLRPGTLWTVGSMEDGPFARLVTPQPGGGYIGGYIEATAKTAENALAAAALRALAEAE